MPTRGHYTCRFRADDNLRNTLISPRIVAKSHVVGSAHPDGGNSADDLVLILRPVDIGKLRVQDLVSKPLLGFFEHLLELGVNGQFDGFSVVVVIEAVPQPLFFLESWR